MNKFEQLIIDLIPYIIWGTLVFSVIFHIYMSYKYTNLPSLPRISAIEPILTSLSGNAILLLFIFTPEWISTDLIVALMIMLILFSLKFADYQSILSRDYDKRKYDVKLYLQELFIILIIQATPLAVGTHLIIYPSVGP